MCSLNPDAVTPLYKQMEDLLMERIASGEFQPGDRLPSVEELANECGVSVVTVRRAIDNLSQKDVVRKKQGKGTYVNAWVFEGISAEVLSFTEACRLNNTKPGARVLALEILDSMEDVTEKLERIGENRVIHVQRLRLVDDKPISIETNYFPMSFAYLLEEDLNDTSLFEIIRRRTGIGSPTPSGVSSLPRQRNRSGATADRCRHAATFGGFCGLYIGLQACLCRQAGYQY